MTRYYLAGPMSNVPQFNVPAFMTASKVLREQGYEIELPVDLNNEEHVAVLMQSPDGSIGVSDKTWGDWLALDVKIVADEVDGIVVLPGWNRSRGARLETFVSFLCGKPVLNYPSMRAVPKRNLIAAWLGPWKRSVVI